MTQLEILNQKLLTLQQLPAKLAYWRFHNQRIVFTMAYSICCTAATSNTLPVRAT